jgi:hypothetical protein
MLRNYKEIDSMAEYEVHSKSLNDGYLGLETMRISLVDRPDHEIRSATITRFGDPESVLACAVFDAERVVVGSYLRVRQWASDLLPPIIT